MIEKYQTVLWTTCDSPTDAISDCPNVDHVRKRYVVTSFFSKRQRITLRLLYAIGRPSVCLSVCLLSVTLVHPTQAVKLFGNFFSPYDSSGTLLFWCQKSLVGDAPFPLKSAFKVTHPLSNSEISTNIGS